MADSRALEVRRELIRREIKRRKEMAAEPSTASSSPVRAPEVNLPGAESTPVSNLRDIAGGVARGAQNLAAFMGEAGQKIGGLASPLRKYIPEKFKVFPDVDIREELGLGKDRPVDLGAMISSEHPNPVLQSAGQYAPAIAAGGISIPRQMAASGLFGVTQAQPGHRIGAGITDAALAGTIGTIGKGLAGQLPLINRAINYLRPKKDAENFLRDLSGIEDIALKPNASINEGIDLKINPLPTKEKNVQSLASEIQSAHQSKLDEALAHKNPVYEQEGKSDIYRMPESALPEGNLEKVAHYIVPGEKIPQHQLNKLAEEIKNYRSGKPDKSGNNTYDFEDFTHNVQEIFNASLSKKQISNLEEALGIPVEHEKTFLNMAEKNLKVMDGDTKSLYQKFKRKPTLENADALQTQLGGDIGSYRRRSKSLVGINKAEEREMKALKELRDTLKSDMQQHLERTNPSLAKENKIYTEKYRENVVPYGEETVTNEITSEPKYIREKRKTNPELPYNVTQEQIKNFFAQPSREAAQIAGDIGASGKQKVLYNLLADDIKPEAVNLANAILKAKQSQGYARYITPEMEQFAKDLIKRAKARKIATTAGGLMGGGIAAGAGFDLGKKLF